MRVIIVYDVGVERVNDVRKILKQYLNWVQNSAFEGDISEGVVEEIRQKLFSVIDPDTDSIIVYSINNPAWIKKRVWGVEKGHTDNIL